MWHLNKLYIIGYLLVGRRMLGFFGHVMRLGWIGKNNDAGKMRWKEDRMTKEKMDE